MLKKNKEVPISERTESYFQVIFKAVLSNNLEWSQPSPDCTSSCGLSQGTHTCDPTKKKGKNHTILVNVLKYEAEKR